MLSVQAAAILAPPTAMLSNAALDDVVAVFCVAIAAIAYLVRGRLWDRQNQYTDKLYERPQEKMGGQQAAAETKDVAVRMQQTVSRLGT